MTKPKKQKSEEELERRRVARREKYKIIKNNPELYAAEQEKKRQNYLKRKESKKIKSINEMSPREQRIQRRKWKESAQKYYKKKISQKIIETVTVREVDSENVQVNFSADPLNVAEQEKKSNPSNTELKLIKKIKTLKMQLRKQKESFTLLLNRYKAKLRGLQRKIFKLSRQTSNEIENTENKEKDKKQLFDKLLSEQITQKFATTTSRKEKRAITNLIDRKKFKNFKVSTDLRKVCLRQRLKKNTQNECLNVQKLVENFYEDDINSRITPGKKQYKKKNGKVKQIRYLLDSMKNLHMKFLAENTRIKISYTTFTRLRPFWVSLPVDDRDTCACTLHTNFNLLISALNKNNIVDAKDSQNLIMQICCDKYNLNCLNRKCDNCKNKMIVYKEFTNDREIQYMEWQKDTKKVNTKEIKIIKKKPKRSDPRNLIIKLENVLPQFLSHTSNIVNQYTTIKELKESLKSNEALVHMDFSENYAYKYAEEVQSMHFGGSRGQVCLHTAVVYIKKEMNTTEVHSLCTVSECTRHDAAAVWAHLDHIIKFVSHKLPQMNRIHILTDGPSSQYRNKYIFYILTQLKNDLPQLRLVTWNYQEAGHGKGAPDGIGAVIKRTADYQVKCRQDVGTFDAFIRIIQKHVKNVQIEIVEEEEIKIKDLMLPKDIMTFKGTMGVHQVVWSSDSTYLEFRNQSCFQCLNTACVHNKHLRFFKIYKTPTESTVHNINIVPENKRIRILNDITIRHVNNQQVIASTSQTTSLCNIRRSWANQSFEGDYTKATGHEKEFLKFIGKSNDNDNSISD